MVFKCGMNIKRIGNIILEVKDLDASIKFYHEILGMPIKNERRNWIDLGRESGGVSKPYILHPLQHLIQIPQKKMVF